MPQSFASHPQNVIDACFTRTGLQIQACATMQIKNVAIRFHQRGRDTKMVQQSLFNKLKKENMILVILKEIFMNKV
jgi:nucleoside diphosphate kinase